MKKLIFTAMTFAPVLALAQSLGNTDTLLTNITDLINKVIPVIFAIGIVYFFWGLVTFIRSSGDPKTHDAAKAQMIWGIIALAIMVSVYGLINWLTGTAGLTTTAPVLPTIQVTS